MIIVYEYNEYNHQYINIIVYGHISFFFSSFLAWVNDGNEICT